MFGENRIQHLIPEFFIFIAGRIAKIMCRTGLAAKDALPEFNSGPTLKVVDVVRCPKLTNRCGDTPT
jgi:hypothetical protein